MNFQEIKTTSTDKSKQAVELWNKYVTQERVETAKNWAKVSAKVTLCAVSLATMLAVIIVGYLIYGLITALDVTITAYSAIKNEAEGQNLLAFIAAQPTKLLYNSTVDYGVVGAMDTFETVAELVKTAYDFEDVKTAVVSKVSQLWSNLTNTLDREAGAVTDPLIYVETTVEVDESQAQDPEELK